MTLLLPNQQYRCPVVTFLDMLKRLRNCCLIIYYQANNK